WLVGPIRAVPHRQFGSNRVVLRAKFELRLAALLPDRIFAYRKGAPDEQPAERLPVVALSVDLFEPSAGPKHFARALALSQAGHTLVQIGQELRLAKRQAHIAVTYG